MLQIYHCEQLNAALLSSAWCWGFLSYTSSSSPAINKHRCLPATGVINLLWSVAAECITLGVYSTRWSQILAQNRNTHLHSTPPLGGSRRNIAITFGVKKLECCDYSMVKKFEDMFIHFDRIHERDKRTNEQIQTYTTCIGRSCIASAVTTPKTANSKNSSVGTRTVPSRWHYGPAPLRGPALRQLIVARRNLVSWFSRKIITRT